ncbi:hypothetical protein AB0F81_27095 [Actinoplanes sp. NPDC024001]|uniref:hypothetical protein n=1 Tax=Actinoplanes sp. NPDC024001 TaxID=3154598 RepID=UPI0033D04362
MSYVASRDGRKSRRAADRDPSVPGRLDDLHGHSVGVLEVPHHMAAGHPSRRRFDLEDPAQRRSAYQHVLCEAANCCEVEDLLNPDLLRRVWRDLHLPAKVRQAWESKHPSLRQTSVARTSSIRSVFTGEAAAGGSRRSRDAVRGTTIRGRVRTIRGQAGLPVAV